MSEITNRRLESLVMYSHEVQNKYVYYILAIDAACTGFTINYTKELILTVHDLILAFALSSWALSFYFGLSQIQNHEVALQLNISHLRFNLEQKQPSLQLRKNQLVAQKKAICYRKWQNWLLFVGVLLFIIWRISI